MDNNASPQPQNFYQVSAQLELGGVDVSTPQVHGIVCGLVCADTKMSASTWPRLIMTDESHSLPVSAALAEALNDLTDDARRALDSSDFEFQLLLPEDETQTERANALGEWCTGYVLGLFANGRNEPNTLPGDAREIVRDIIEIAGADIDTGADDGEATEKEVEHALMEIEEYLRVGVQLVYEELQDADSPAQSGSGDSVSENGNPGGNPGPTVH